MAIDADTAFTPDVLVLRARGHWPILSDAHTLRTWLVSNGHLTPETRALIDVRDVLTPVDTEAERVIMAAASADDGLPAVRAYLIGSAVQSSFARQLQVRAPGRTRIGVFSTEQAAFMWLHQRDQWATIGAAGADREAPLPPAARLGVPSWQADARAVSPPH
jgi:hypothetical protein